MKLPTVDTRQHYPWGIPSTSKDILHRNPDTHKTGSAKEAKNITPKFHFWRKLRLMVAVYEASMTTV
jgi:hypothetical protein